MNIYVPRAPGGRAFHYRSWMEEQPVRVVLVYGLRGNFMNEAFARKHGIEYSAPFPLKTPRLMTDCRGKTYLVVGEVDRQFEIDLGDDKIGMFGLVVRLLDKEDEVDDWDVVLGRRLVVCVGHLSDLCESS